MSNKHTLKNRMSLVLLISMIGSGLAATTAFSAESMFWDNTNHTGAAWNTLAGWRLPEAIPTSSDLPRIKTDIAITNGINAIAAEVYLSFGGTGTVTLDMSGGSLDVGGRFRWGHNSVDTNSVINLSDGDIDIGGNFELANLAHHDMTLNMTGGTLTAQEMTVIGGSATFNIGGGTFTVKDSITQSSVNNGRVVDFGSGDGRFVVEWDFWDAAEQDQIWATRWYTWYMKSDQGAGAVGVAWHYDDTDPLNRKTVFGASTSPFWDNTNYTGSAWDTVAGWSTGVVPTALDRPRVKTDISITNGINAAAADFYLSFGGTGTVVMNMSGGALDVGGLFRWTHNTSDTNSIINLSGGDINIGGDFVMANHSNAYVTLNMAGGTLTTKTMTVFGGNTTFNIDGGTFTITDAIDQTSTHAGRAVDFGSGDGRFVVEWDFWDPAEQNQGAATNWYAGWMQSDEGFGSFDAGAGVAWYYDDSDPLNRKTVFQRSPKIISISVASGDALKLVVSAPGNSLGNLYPKSKADLVLGTWLDAAHSDSLLNPYEVTNLNYSVVEGSNIAIYVESNEVAEFFRIDVE